MQGDFQMQTMSQTSPNLQSTMGGDKQQDTQILIFSFNNKSERTYEAKHLYWLLNPYLPFGKINKIFIFQQMETTRFFLETSTPVLAQTLRKKLNNYYMEQLSTSLNVSYSNKKRLEIESNNKFVHDFLKDPQPCSEESLVSQDQEWEALNQQFYERQMEQQHQDIIQPTQYQNIMHPSYNRQISTQLNMQTRQNYSREINTQQHLHGIPTSDQVPPTWTHFAQPTFDSNFPGLMSLPSIDHMVPGQSMVHIQSTGTNLKQSRLSLINSQMLPTQYQLQNITSYEDDSQENSNDFSHSFHSLQDIHSQGPPSPCSLHHAAPSSLHHAAPSSLHHAAPSRVLFMRDVQCIYQIKTWHVYNLFSNFGNIKYVLIKRLKKVIVVQFENALFSKYAMAHLNNLRFFGNAILLEYSRLDQISLQKDKDVSFQVFGHKHRRLDSTINIQMHPPSNTVYITNIESNMSEKLLRFYVEPFGEITAIKLQQGTNNKQNGLIIMKQLNDAVSLVTKLHNQQIIKNQIKVSFYSSQLCG